MHQSVIYTFCRLHFSKILLPLTFMLSPRAAATIYGLMIAYRLRYASRIPTISIFCRCIRVDFTLFTALAEWAAFVCGYAFILKIDFRMSFQSRQFDGIYANRISFSFIISEGSALRNFPKRVIHARSHTLPARENTCFGMSNAAYNTSHSRASSLPPRAAAYTSSLSFLI